MTKIYPLSIIAVFLITQLYGENPVLIEAKYPISRIVRSGKEEPIVPYGNRRNNLPSCELAYYLEKLTGNKPNIIEYTENLKNKTGLIFLGESALKAGAFNEKELKDVQPDAFRIRIKNGNIYIIGGKYRGVEYGIYFLLEKLGIKFYATDFEFVPDVKKPIKLPSMDIFDKPYFELREITGAYNRQGQHTIAYDVGFGSKSYPELSKLWNGIMIDHTCQLLCPVTTYGKEHPEYYAKTKGGRFLAKDFLKNWRKGKAPNFLQVCLSNSEVRKISEKRLLDWIEKQKNRRFFYIMQMDGCEWCQCKNCKEMNYQKNNYTDLLLNFVNDLARHASTKFPDKVFVGMSYLKFTGRPPIKEKMEKNVRIALCAYTPEVQDRAHDISHPKNKIFYEWYKGWLDKFDSSQIYIYDYPIVNTKALFFTREAIYKKMKRYYREGLKGIYFDGRPLFMRELFIYVTGKLSWNPKLDSNKLTDEFIEKYYGKSSKYIKNIYDILKNISEDQKRSQGPDLDSSVFYTEKELNDILSLYDKAEDAAKDNPKILRKIQSDKSFALYSYLTKINPVKGTCKDMPLFKKRLGDFLNIALRNDCLNIFKVKANDWIKSWLWKTARLKVDISSWKGNSRLTAMRNAFPIQGLIKNPDSVKISETSDVRKIQLLPNKKGWKVPLEMFKEVQEPIVYNWKCPPQDAIFIRAKQTGFPTIARVYFNLNHLPKNSELKIKAQDDDKPGRTPIRIILNQKEIFTGKNNFAEQGWSTIIFKLPDGTLKKGKNELSIEDISETKDLYSKWLAISEVKITTKEKIPEQPKLLFKADFNKNLNADKGANNEANVLGELLLSNEGFSGRALDANYTKKSSGSLFFQAAGNYSLSEGTIEMWIKPKWDPNTDAKTRVFLHITSGNNRSGLYLFKYGSQKYISLIMYNDKKNTGDGGRGFIGNWKPDSWHHLAVTWNKKDSSLQMFLDGKLVFKQLKATMGKELADRIYIGSRHLYGEPANALIDNVKIYDKPLWQGNEIEKTVFNPEKKQCNQDKK